VGEEPDKESLVEGEGGSIHSQVRPEWNSTSLCSTNISVYRAALKRSTDICVAKIMSINSFSCLKLSVVFKKTFFVQLNQISVVN
jgi:hypothetical protein